ncbi:heat shock protein 70b [Echinococcus multilocularis]|uniref:Heat shock protein 70b n=1 Tax=Echinococcus multilocularis TaxID=6211 RepID=A0A068YBT7_ECHMU|nr:heat shock protein 70b [Echinococcus multilocularis]
MPTGPAIGIDLGTSFSCVGVFKHNSVEIVANDQDHRTTPTCVAFTDRERLFGEAAMYQMGVNHTNTVFDVKRLIGRTFDDEAVQDDMKHWPFKVINSQGTPKIEVEYRGEKKQFVAEEISAMVLQKMKETAEAYLGERVTDAVITVPAYFSSRQRRATIDAGKIAGLNVLRLINEPTAAAIAYGVKKRSERQHNVLVFDWGGGTLDVSILSIENGAFEVKAVGGDTHLGGEDINSRLVNHCVEEFKQMHEGRDLTTKAINRLRKACETAKRKLSTIDCTNVEVVSLFEDMDFCMELTRDQFEQLCLDLFSRMMDVVKSALSAAKMERTDIDEILLVGGSTRIPKVQTMLQEYFNGRELNRTVNADEAVAYGATLLAAKLTDALPKSMQHLSLLEVTPLSLCLEFPDGTLKKIVEGNTQIPIKLTRPYGTKENSAEAVLGVFEGECKKASDIYILGNFSSPNTFWYILGHAMFYLAIEIDESGIFHVSEMKNFCWKQNITTPIKGTVGLSEEEIKRMINDAKKMKLEDEKERSRMAAMNVLVDCIYTIKAKMESEETKQTTSEELRQELIGKCEEMIRWTDMEKNSTKEDFERNQSMLEEMYKGVTMVKQRSTCEEMMNWTDKEKDATMEEYEQISKQLDDMYDNSP